MTSLVLFLAFDIFADMHFGVPIGSTIRAGENRRLIAYSAWCLRERAHKYSEVRSAAVWAVLYVHAVFRSVNLSSTVCSDAQCLIARLFHLQELVWIAAHVRVMAFCQITEFLFDLIARGTGLEAEH